MDVLSDAETGPRVSVSDEGLVSSCSRAGRGARRVHKKNYWRKGEGNWLIRQAKWMMPQRLTRRGKRPPTRCRSNRARNSSFLLFRAEIHMLLVKFRAQTEQLALTRRVLPSFHEPRTSLRNDRANERDEPRGGRKCNEEASDEESRWYLQQERLATRKCLSERLPSARTQFSTQSLDSRTNQKLEVSSGAREFEAGVLKHGQAKQQDEKEELEQEKRPNILLTNSS